MSVNLITELMVNLLRVLLIRKLMELFLPAEEEGEKKVLAAAVCYYLLTSVLYGIVHLSALYEACNFIGIAGLCFFYPGTWKKRIFVALAVFATDLACALAVYFAFSREGVMHQQAIRTLLLFICVTVIRPIASRAEDGEIAFDQRQAGILILIPGAGIFILCVLLYEGFEGAAATLICVSVLIISLSVFFLYHMMADHYRSVREQELYRQQTFAYQNQLEVITESQGRIRALRHDMKNHILVLQMLLQKGDLEETRRYLAAMQDFMANPSEYIETGNETVDSLLNYKLQRAREVLQTVEAGVCIPEKLVLHSFDLNVVLGNLLDNAIEAAAETEEKKLKLTMELEKGVLFLHVRNSCQGIADGWVQRLKTTKAGASDHGIGLSSVRRIVEKYHGDMEMICENGDMETDIVMYISEM